MRSIPRFAVKYDFGRVNVFAVATYATVFRRFMKGRAYLIPPNPYLSIIIGLLLRKQQDCRCSTTAKLLQYPGSGPIDSLAEPIREAMYKTDRKTMPLPQPHVVPAMTGIVVGALATLASGLTGCHTTGPWSGQAYETPTAGSPARRTVMTPGAPSPFEQTLPAGNAPRNSAMGSSTR